MADEREASTPAEFACTDGALPVASSSAALNVIGSAQASEGMAEANKAVEIRAARTKGMNWRRIGKLRSVAFDSDTHPSSASLKICEGDRPALRMDLRQT